MAKSSRQRDVDAAKKLLAESGYANEPVSCIVAQDQVITKAQGDVTADLLKRIGMNVDFVATDWGTVGSRRAQKEPPDQGGWDIFHTWHAGADCMNPGAVYRASEPAATRRGSAGRTCPDRARRNRPLVRAPNLDAEKAAVAGSTRRRWSSSSMRRPASSWVTSAWRKNVSGIVKGAVPVFLGCAKTA